MSIFPAEPDDTTTQLVAAVLAELGIEEADATPLQTTRLHRLVRASVSKVLTSLNRDSFTTRQESVAGLWRDEAYPFADLRAWPNIVGYFHDRVRYEFHVVNPDEPDTYNVTFQVGLGLTDPDAGPIVDYIINDVLEQVPGDTAFPEHERRITSVSGGGQSISWEKRASSPDAAGGALTLDSLRRFKRYNVGVSTAPARAPFPYYGSAR